MAYPNPITTRLALLFTLGTLAVAPLALRAFVEGPSPGMTGGFGEPTCQKCHFDNSLNDADGSLQVSGIPQSYFPGNRYPITITLKRPEMERGGFEMSARFAKGRRAGQQAGILAPAEPLRMQLVESPDRKLQYVQHTKQGAEALAVGELEWVVEWRAPESPASNDSPDSEVSEVSQVGPVVFHVAANASNRDDSPLGDFIYLTSRLSMPAPKARTIALAVAHR